jgi:hypothetical protein
VFIDLDVLGIFEIRKFYAPPQAGGWGYLRQPDWFMDRLLEVA